MPSLSCLINYEKAFLNYKLKRTVCSHYPLMIWIEPTSYCNVRCIMCPNPKLDSGQTGHMPMERFKKIVDSVTPYVSSVSICHRGEPLMQKNLCEMIEYCSNSGLNTSIHTNGTMLTEDLSRRLIKSGLSIISFSFDGYIKEAYENIRVGADFEKVRNNILQFLNVKKEMNSKTPHTSIQIIDFEDLKDKISTEEKRNFINLFKGLPLDRLYIKPAHNWAGDAKSNEDNLRSNVKSSRCNSPWYSLVFHWDGSVYTCCLDYMGKYPLGNIDEKPWIDIWNGERMRQLRYEMNTGKFDKCIHCTHCDKLYEKKFLGVSTKNVFNVTLFKTRWILGLLRSR